jgi:hypothetical protein
MTRLSIATRKALEARDDQWITTAEELAHNLRGGQDKEGQLRHIQSLCETTSSWKAVELFIRYQAARKQIDSRWAEATVETLEGLRDQADQLRRQDDDPAIVHLEIVARVLGYAVRCHVWDFKGEKTK